MPVQHHLPHHIAQDYRWWEGDWELIDGYRQTRAPDLVLEVISPKPPTE